MLRRYWFASITLLASFGCHASPPSKLDRAEPPITESDISATRFIALYNKNADAIQSLKARPSIVALGEHGERLGKLSGNLAFERDKNFRLELDGPMRHTVADIGSNDQGFWFWVEPEKKKENSIYVCNHEDLNSCQLALTLQPDWIIEAMGLRRFSEDEARKVHAKPGEIQGTLILTQVRKDAKGQTYTKETLVNQASGTVREHKLYLGLKKELIASATVINYVKSTLNEPVPRGTVVEPDAAPIKTVVYTPDRFKINWIKENFALEIAMPSPTINPKFEAEVRADLFSEPKVAGRTRRDLAQLDLNTEQASASRVYESRPIPQSGIKLGSPVPTPMGLEGTRRRATDPIPLSADLSSTPAQPAGIVGAVVPTAPDSDASRTSAAGNWRSPSLAR